MPKIPARIFGTITMRVNRLNSTKMGGIYTRCILPLIAALLCPSSLVFAQFEARAEVRLPNETINPVVGDFNRDGKLDIAVVGDYVSVLLGNGDGTFHSPVNYPGSVTGLSRETLPTTVSWTL